MARNYLTTRIYDCGQLRWRNPADVSVPRAWARIFVALTLTMVMVAFPSAVASADNPGEWRPGDPVPADGTPRSPVAMQQSKTCATSARLPDSQFSSIPAMSAGVFPVKELHRFATGAGVTVGVIDSGVNPNARLPRLRGAGDYITDTNGLFDCDQHGTQIAGLIGAAPGPSDDFVGVAPGVTILSARQTSAMYRKVRYDDEEPASLDLLAKAIVHLANLGAKVINMSVTACVAPGTQVREMAQLRGAMRYAAVEKDVVLVTPAGNVGENCEQNPAPNPAVFDDPLGWKSLTTWSLPSIVDEFILSVGGSTLEGDQYVNTLWGPWVDVSAPAMNIISLDPEGRDKGGLVNASLTQKGTSPISGTSFASAMVAGLAALIREANPSLNQAQVRNLIMNSTRPTAGTMTPIFGTGHVDPIKALTGAVSSKPKGDPNIPAQRMADEALPPRLPDTAKIVGLTVLSVVVLAVICLIVMAYLSRATKEPETALDSDFGEDFGEDDEEEEDEGTDSDFITVTPVPSSDS